MTLAPHLEKLLAALPAPDRLQFADLIEAFYTMRFTGITVIHWRGGRPHQIELGAPIRLTIVEGELPAVPRGVDSTRGIVPP